jgi:DNA-binding transcriptional MerR regulator
MTAPRGDDGEARDGVLFCIGRLAAETGVSNRTIRYYEDLGILPELPRPPGGTRKYPREYRFFVEGALALKELGFALEEIRLIGRMALSQPMKEEQQEEASRLVAERVESLERKIKVLTRLRDVLDDHRVNGIDDGNRIQHFVHLFDDDPSSERPGSSS